MDERNVTVGALGMATKEWEQKDVNLCSEKKKLDMWKRQQEQHNVKKEESRKSPQGTRHHTQ